MKRSHEKIGAFLTLYVIGIAAGIPWASEMASSAGYPDDLHRIAETVLAGAIGFVILDGGIVSLFARNDGMSIDENGVLPDGGNAQTVHPIPTIKSKTWTRVVIEIDYGGPGGAAPTLTVTLRQPPTAPATPEIDHIAISPTVKGAAITVSIGLEDMNLPSVVGWRTFFDNVLIEAP